MNPLRTPVACLLVCGALALAACEPSRAPVEIDYTFAGQGCQAAGVATIQIDLLGEVLSPNQYSCAVAGKGIDIGRYLGGRYSVTVKGFDAAGNLTHQVTQDIDVRGGRANLFTIDVPRIAPRNGSITLFWSFAGQTCAQAGITAVRVTLDGQLIGNGSGSTDLPCRLGTDDGTTIGDVDAGTHRVDLQAIKGGQVAYSLSNLTAVVQAGQDTQLSPNLIASSTSSASASLRWTFAGMSCADAKVSTVRVAVDGGAPAEFACSTAGADGAVITNLSGGSHGFTLEGVRTGATSILAYQSTTATTANFSIGLTTQVLVDAPAASPGRGGAKLIWQFPSGGPVCSSTAASTAVTYTLKSPTGQVTNGTSTCGGATANLGVEFCNPTASGCAAPGLAAGYWTIDATATSGATYKATAAKFPVPNGDQTTTTVVFVQQ